MSEHPGEHPEPPVDLESREPVMITLDQAWYRSHKRERSALFFGRTRGNRFDSPDASYGVLYLAADHHGAFIETYGQSTGIRLITRESLSQRLLTSVSASRPLRLIDLASSGGLARLGADGRLCTSSHRVAQRWSEALRRHPARPDGLYYPARHDLARFSCALFEDAAELITTGQSICLAAPSRAELLADILDTYGFGLADL